MSFDNSLSAFVSYETGLAVRWTAVAERDLTEIITYIAQDCVSRAETILHTITKSASKLHHSPKRGRILPEPRAQGITVYRELIIAPWRLIYRISDQTVFVLALLDSRRNIEDLLLQRLLQQ